MSHRSSASSASLSPRWRVCLPSFLDVLNEYYPQQEVERRFATAVDWGRYAELFEYDADDGRLRLAEVGAPA